MSVAEVHLDNKFDSDWKHEMKVSDRLQYLVHLAHSLSCSSSGQRRCGTGQKGRYGSLTDRSEGLADQEYCARMEMEVPVTAQYLLDRGSTWNLDGGRVGC